VLPEVWPFVSACRAEGQPVVLARVVARTGDPGRPLGAALAVAADGRWAGSVAGGCVDGDVLETAATVHLGLESVLTRCETGSSETSAVSVLVSPLFGAWACAAIDRILATSPTEMQPPAPLLLHTALTPPYDTTLGPAGDGLPVMVEVIRPAPRLVLVGATDIAVSLAAFATAAGFRVVVVEPRPAYALASRVPAATLVRAWPSTWLGSHALGADDSLIALTHEPRLDDAALVQALMSGCGYVAAIGGRLAQEERLARLAHIPGVQRIAGPAGLDLGGSSSAQTALSMLAEVVAVRNQRAGGRLVHGRDADIDDESGLFR
jgi:xanthine dehydrogenase accessory factor